MSSLQDALAAFRAQTNTARGEGEQTLRRILDRRDQGHRRAAVAALALLALGGSALAWVSVRQAAVVAVARSASSAPFPAPPPSAPLATLPSPPPTAALPPAWPSAHSRGGAPAHRSANLARGSGKGPTDSDQVEDDAFARAQAQHTARAGSPGELEAWNSYLASYPTGRFAPEARFRRAVTLAQLQRWEAARAALRPFVEGAYGAYRHAEAEEWMRAIPDR